jgi:hypothetical protein
MRYIVLLRADQPSTPPPPELMEAIMKLGKDAAKAGALLDTAGLSPSAAGARVELAAGRMTVTDGPFTESKEHIGGFWVIVAADLDEALVWASKATRACGEPVEVRPFQEEPEG